MGVFVTLNFLVCGELVSWVGVGMMIAARGGASLFQLYKCLDLLFPACDLYESI